MGGPRYEGLGCATKRRRGRASASGSVSLDPCSGVQQYRPPVPTLYKGDGPCCWRHGPGLALVARTLVH
eukprot:241522-Karenia_brevis.AAC.1